MGSHRGTAAAVGLLFVVATLCPVLGGVLIGSPIAAQDVLGEIAARRGDVTLAALLELIMVVAILAIAVLLYPVLRQDRPGVARSYLVARTLEVIPLTAGAVALLALVSLGREAALYAATTSPEYRSLSELLIAAHDWTALVGGQVFFSLAALILNVSLHRSRLVPRALSVWGIVGVPLMFASGLLGMFGGVTVAPELGMGLVLPLAVQEMALALWLIAKGFRQAPATQAEEA